MLSRQYIRDELNLKFLVYVLGAAWKDAVEEACEKGIGVIAEPGGSMRDSDAIDCCNKYGVSLLFTNVRHFRHWTPILLFYILSYGIWMCTRALSISISRGFQFCNINQSMRFVIDVLTYWHSCFLFSWFLTFCFVFEWRTNQSSVGFFSFMTS